MTYLPRVIDDELDLLLETAGAVLIEGPRACGKTASARRVCHSEVLLDVDQEARATLAIDPSLILDGQRPRLIDEWQIEPRLWDYVRRAVDDGERRGAFLLTGSAVPADDVTRHTGAGRITRLRMRPMSLSESGHSNGSISLAALFHGEPARSARTDLGLVDLIDLACVGGWPGDRERATHIAMRSVRDYVDQISRADIQRVDGVDRDPARVTRTLRALARNVATYASASTIAQDSGGPDGPLHDDTVREYLAALDRLMITEDVPPWSTHLRSKSVVRSSSKRHFVDPSIAVAAMGATPERLLKDLNLFGFVFESLVVRDLRVYAQAMEANVFQYRDNTGLEVDAIVEGRDGRWGAFEVKLGVGQVDAAAASLLRFADRVDTSRVGEPAVLGVIVGTGYGFRRDDGVQVIPIGALTR